MTETCNACGSPLFDKADPSDIKAALDRTLTGIHADEWDDYEDRFWSLLTLGREREIPGLGSVTLVHEEIPKPYDSYYGEFHQGYEGEAIAIILVNCVHYKNTAPQNSYGRVQWHRGELTRTEPKTKTIQIWE